MSGREQSWTYGGSSVVVRQVRPGVALIRLSGVHDDLRAVQRLEGWFSRFAARGPRVHLFWDTSETTGHRPECREALEGWHRRAQPRLESCTVLVRSKLLAAALSVSTWVTRSRVHSATADRRKFEARLAALTRPAAPLTCSPW